MRLTRIPLLTLAVLATAMPALAESREEARERQIPESVRRVEHETGGRVLQVRPVQRGDREVYRMKVLMPEGRVRVMQDDPRRTPREAPPRPARERDDG